MKSMAFVYGEKQTSGDDKGGLFVDALINVFIVWET